MQLVSINVTKKVTKMQNFKRKVQTAPTYLSSVINKHSIDTKRKKMAKTYFDVTRCNFNLFRSILAIFGNPHRDPKAKPFKLYTWKALGSWVTGAVQIWTEIIVELWQFPSVNTQVVGAHEKKKDYTFIVCTPPPLSAREVEPNFRNGGGGLTRTQLLMTKKVYKQKYFSVITKNSNWETLPKNLVTFKR